MHSRQLIQKLLTLLTVFSILFSSVVPVVNAAPAISIYSPPLAKSTRSSQSASDPTLQSTPSPNTLSPAMEELRARRAMETALTKYLATYGTHYQENLAQVYVEGEWAYATTPKEVASKAAAESLTLLAHRTPSGEWQALLPQDSEGYAQWLNSIPETLVALDAKEQFRTQAIQAAEPVMIEQVTAQPTATPTPSGSVAASAELSSTVVVSQTSIITTSGETSSDLGASEAFSNSDNLTSKVDADSRVFLPFVTKESNLSNDESSNSLDSQHSDSVMGLSFRYDSSVWVPTLLADNGTETPDGVSIRTIGLANESEGAWLIIAAFRNVVALDLDQWIRKYDYSGTDISPTYREHVLSGFPAVTINEAFQEYQGTPPNMRTIVSTGATIYLIEYASMGLDSVKFEHFLEKIQFFARSTQFSGSSLSLTLAESYNRVSKTLHASQSISPNTQLVQTCCGVTDPEFNPFPCPSNGSAGNCTWWVRYRRTGDNRANLYACIRNADTWDECAAMNYPDLLASSPSVNAAAVWTGSGQNHVQFIERINSNGSYHVSEMNWPDPPPGTCQRDFDQTRTSNIQFIRHPSSSGSDTTRPDGGITSPSEGATITNRTVRLDGWGSDSQSGFDHAHFTANYAGSWRQVGGDFTSSPFGFDWDMCNAGVPDGSVEIGLDIWDKAGNQANSPGGIRRFTKNVNCNPEPPSCNPNADQVALYDDPDRNNNGSCVTLNIGEYREPGALGGLGNDVASSIKIGSNVQAILYSDADYSGRAETFTGEDGNLADNPIGTNSVSSVKVQRRTSPPNPDFDAWPQNGNAPLNVSMHIVSTDNITSCSWEYGDGATGTSCNGYHDHNYVNAGSYTVKLTVTGPGGSNFKTRTNYISVTNPVQPPSPPTLQSPSNGATFNEGASINLAWSSTGDQYYGEITGGPNPLTFGWQNETSKNIGSQWAGYTYSWRVKAKNSAGESGWSSTWTFIVKPATPTNLSAQAASRTQINLAWTDNSGNEDGYKLYRNGSFLTQVGAGATSYQDTSASCNTTYTYQVKSFRGSIESDGSNSASATTQACTSLPSAPALQSPNNGATFNEGASINLAWSSTGDQYYGEITGGPNPLTFGWQNETSKNIGSQWAGYTYSWRVKAKNSAGESGWSSIWTFTVKPATPTNLSAQAASRTQINLAWTDNSGNEEGYKLYRNGSFLTQVNAGATSYQDASASCNTTYTYQVKAFRGSIESDASSTASATTSTCEQPKPDLAPYQGANWPFPVVPASVPDTFSSSTLYANHPTYFDWGVKNQGNAATGALFYVDLFIDNTRFIHYPFNSDPGGVTWFIDWNQTVDLTGQHTLKIVVDPDNVIAESDETNNVWQGQFTWTPVSGWWGEYFNSLDLSGNPVLVRDDPNINFDWGADSPGTGVNTDFSARWTRNLTFDPGLYRFSATHDDGLRLWVDDQLTLDQWDTCCQTDTADVSLTAGQHALRTEFRDTAGSAVAQLSWSPIACGNDNLEPNNAPDQAKTIAYNQTLQATICPVGDEDYYVFSGHAGDKIVADLDAQVNGSALDAYLYLLDSDGAAILTSNDDENPAQTDSHLGYTLPHDGNYYLRVRDFRHPHAGGENYFYSLHLSTDSVNPYLAQITAPHDNDWLNPNQTTVTVSADDHESGVSRVEFLWHDGNWSNPDWVWLGADQDGSDGWRWNFDTSTLPEQQGAAFYVWVFDWAGNLAATAVWELGIDRTLPASAVLPLPATSGASFTVGWSGSDATSGIANYDIQYRDGATGNWTDWLVDTTNTSAVFSGQTGHIYYFRARASDRAGNLEDWPANSAGDTSTEVRPPLTAPSNLVATTAGRTQINLSWADNSNNESGFKVERSLDGINSWTQLGTVGAGVKSYANTGLTCATTYHYRVRAYNASGDSAYSNVGNAQTAVCVPVAPSNLTATAAGQTQINLSWVDSNNNESGVKIERSPNGTNSWTQIGTVGANVITYPNTGLTCGTTYYYRVRAYNASGDSGYSNIATAQPAACPTPTPSVPSNLVATAAGQTQINLSWADNSNNETGFKIERSPDGTNSWTEIGTVGAGVKTYANTGLTCGTTYYYRVRAYNTGGNSAYSNVTNTQTMACISDPIFADGFEAGNLSAWTASTNPVNLSVLATPVALVGSKGLQITINSNTATYLTDDRPNAEPRYRARFYFDPNTITMASNNAHYIFYGYTGTATVVLRIEFRKSGNNYQLSAGLVNDSTTWNSSSWFTITDESHFVELDWKASTTTSARNGYLTLWIDNAQKANLTGIDNDTRRIDRIQLGAVTGIDTGTRGTYYFDAFDSRRQTYIGPAVAAQSAVVAEPETLLNPLPEEADVPITLSATTVVPGTDSSLSGDVDGLLMTALLPASIINEPATFVLNKTDNHTRPDGYSLLGGMFELQLAVNGTPIAALEQPLTVTANYGSLIDSADQSAEVTLQAWDAANESWTVVPATINAAEHTLTAAVSQPTLLAVFQKDAVATTQIYLPVIQR